jgi:hypothetical protein
MKPIFTHKLPDKEGYYWWTNFGEHTPVILEVVLSNGKLWAQNEEFIFEVEEAKYEKDPDMLRDGHYYGEEMWAPVELPTLDGREVKPSSY